MKILKGDLWRRPEFMKLWSAQTFSEFGARFARDGLPLTAVLVMGANPGQVGVLAALATAPRVVVGLLAGGYVDRSRRRRTMIASDLVRAALLATIPLAALLHRLSLAQLYVVAAVVGAASVVFDIANQAYFPILVDSEHLAEGNTKLSVTASLANVAGPALTGLLIQLLSAPLAVGVTFVSYVASAGLLGAVKDREQAAPQKADAWLRDFREGLALVFADHLMRPVCLMDATANVFVPMFAALYPFIAFRELHLTPFMFGATFGAGGLGALAGAWLRPRLTGRLGLGPASLACIFLAGAVSFVIPLTYAPPLLAALILSAAQFAGDGFSTISGVTINTLRQSAFRTDSLGRVNAVFQVLDGGAAMLGALAGGLLGQAFGPRAGMLVAASGLTAATLWALFSPLRTLSAQPGPRRASEATS